MVRGSLVVSQISRLNANSRTKTSISQICNKTLNQKQSISHQIVPHHHQFLLAHHPTTIQHPPNFSPSHHLPILLGFLKLHPQQSLLLRTLRLHAPHRFTVAPQRGLRRGRGRSGVGGGVRLRGSQGITCQSLVLWLFILRVTCTSIKFLSG